MEIVTETVRVVLGASLGTLAVYFAMATFRAWYSGSDAYEANRAATARSLRSVLGGQVGHSTDGRKRNSLGIALELDSGRIVSQQQLSKEAVEDVIGRRV